MAGRLNFPYQAFAFFEIIPSAFVVIIMKYYYYYYYYYYYLPNDIG